jgi:hypothetical protein
MLLCFVRAQQYFQGYSQYKGKTMGTRVILNVEVVRSGTIRTVLIRIDNKDIPLRRGKGQFEASQGVEYDFFWQIDGGRGSSIALTISDEDGNVKKELDDAYTAIRGRLGMNAGSNAFVA